MANTFYPGMTPERLRAQFRQQLRLPSTGIKAAPTPNVPQGMLSEIMPLNNGIAAVSVEEISNLGAFNPLKAVGKVAKGVGKATFKIATTPVKAVTAVPRALVKTGVAVVKGENVGTALKKNAIGAAKQIVGTPFSTAKYAADAVQSSVKAQQVDGSKKSPFAFIAQARQIAERTAQPPPATPKRSWFQSTIATARQIGQVAKDRSVSVVNSDAPYEEREAAAQALVNAGFDPYTGQPLPAGATLTPPIIPPPEAPAPVPQAGPPSVQPQQPMPNQVYNAAVMQQQQQVQQQAQQMPEQAVKVMSVDQQAPTAIPPPPEGLRRFLVPGLAIGGGVLALLTVGLVVSRRGRGKGVNAYDYED